MKRASRLVIAGLLVAPAALAGCVGSKSPSHITVLEPLPVMGSFVSLGAGDALGRAVFINDIILAAGRADERVPVVVDAPVEFELDAEPR